MLQEGKSIKNCFEDYDGSNDYQETTEYIESRFLNPLKDIEFREPGNIPSFIILEKDGNCVTVIYDTIQNYAIKTLIKDKYFA